MNKELMFSSKTDQWSTPQDFFDKLEDIYQFNLDVCADSDNTKCSTNYITETENSLLVDWNNRVYPSSLRAFMNPPYGRGMYTWIKKAYEESKKGGVVVCLLPARTDTKWFHEFCVHGKISFLKGRLKFGNQENSAPFPSMVVVFNSILK